MRRTEKNEVQGSYADDGDFAGAENRGRMKSKAALLDGHAAVVAGIVHNLHVAVAAAGQGLPQTDEVT
jgi:hypothetical protein